MPGAWLINVPYEQVFVYGEVFLWAEVFVWGVLGNQPVSATHRSDVQSRAGVGGNPSLSCTGNDSDLVAVDASAGRSTGVGLNLGHLSRDGSGTFTGDDDRHLGRERA
jgi:hypothetical protein